MNKKVLRDIADELKTIRKQEGLRSYLWARPFLHEEALQKNLYYAWYREKEKKISGNICFHNNTTFSIAIYLPHSHTKKLLEQWDTALKNNFMEYKRKLHYKKVEFIPINKLNELMIKSTGEFIIFVRFGDILEANALSKISTIVREQPEVDIIYSDEDQLDKDNVRVNPFFKPDWSPDTLMSFCYMGNLVCVRTNLLKKCHIYNEGDFILQLYSAILEMTEQAKSIKHIPEILYHNNGDFIFENELIETAQIKKKALVRRGYTGEVVWESLLHRNRVIYSIPVETPGVDIIIPSKDHFLILKRCIESLVRLTEYKNYRITVIDNGSSIETQKRIEEFSSEVHFRYIYYPMEFNFSKMCNIGAEESQGEYLLFLNDDIEIIQSNWLNILLGHASLPYIGAVGAKLLYPNSNVIQHIGVTNLKIGPAHKLSLETDEISHYFDRNNLEYNYLAVTGACMLLSREKFELAGRFDESMKVRYNDVSLCMTLYEKGYFNVVRNDVKLYHHESISRGDDTLSREKMLQLIQERTQLYEKHPGFVNADPFYNPNLVDHKTLYQPDYIYVFERRTELSRCRPFKKQIKSEWINESFHLYIEKIEWKDEYLYLEGWSFVVAADNSAYKRRILLRECKDGGEIIEVSLAPRYRDDVVAQFPEEKNIGLAGFVCRVPKNTLKKGKTYNVAMLAKARFSRQVLFIASSSKVQLPNEYVHNE